MAQSWYEKWNTVNLQAQKLAGTNGPTLVFMRVGDFYETFGFGAEDCAKALGLPLTQRCINYATGAKTAMVGIPCHDTVAKYAELERKGYKVLSLDAQTESEPAPALAQAGAKPKRRAKYDTSNRRKVKPSFLDPEILSPEDCDACRAVLYGRKAQNGERE